MDTATGGLRERKKAATRQALHEAAVRLAMAHGPDRVTIEAIADAASVSRRTFSNYFAGKEEALLHGDRCRMRGLLELVRARPGDEPPWRALTAAALELLPQAGVTDPESLNRVRLIREHPSLLAEQVAMFASFEHDLAAEVAARLGEDPAGMRARLLASAFLSALRVALHVWLDQPERASLEELVEQALAEVAQRFD